MTRPVPGSVLPDAVLPDADGAPRRLSELPDGDPLIVHTYRGWFCPKERTYFRQVLLPLQEIAEVGYVRMVSVSTEPPPVSAAFRAGLDARWTFLSDTERTWQAALDLREVTDTVHDPYLPTVFVCDPDLTVRRAYNGYWMWGRPTLDELWADLRDAGEALRPDWDPPVPDLAWLALLDAPATGSVPVGDPDGNPAGHLLVRAGRAKPHRLAVRIEPSLLGDGPALAVSLVLPAGRPLFDDPAVVGAMRAVLRDPSRTAVFSTLVASSTRWAGSLSGVAPEVAVGWPAWWDGDPFARLGRQRRLLVPAGVFVPSSLPIGPNHQRHAGAPWPWGRFEGRWHRRDPARHHR